MSAYHASPTHRQEALISALLTLPTIGAAAKSAHISEATARRWMALPQVQAAYRDARRLVIEQAFASIQAVTDEAVGTLRACLASSMPPAVRVRAAIALLDTAIRAVEMADLAQRIEHLEEALAIASDQPRRIGSYAS